MEIKRDKYVNDLVIRKNNGMVKVITGIRRCGKSYLLNKLFYDELIRDGIDEAHIIRFSFDSMDDLSLIGEDLFELAKNRMKVDLHKFMDYISTRITDDSRYYLLLDEVQNLNFFELVLNSYLKNHNIDIYVTGSNSKFLSSDVITEFRGRGDEIHVLPLSFPEFFNTRNDDFESALDEYYSYGGLPQVAILTTEEQKMNYLKSQIKNVYLKDIVYRYNLKDDVIMNDLLNVLASGISTLVNFNKLANTFKSVKKVSISINTIEKYINCLKDAFLVSLAKRYDIKGKRYIDTPFKIYFEDLGLKNALLNFSQIERTNAMENLIYNELRYRDFNVDVGVVQIQHSVGGKRTQKQHEIDFIANKGLKKYYIQSAYSINDESKLKQETASLDAIDDSFKKVIITNDYQIPKKNEKGYLFIGLKTFLSDPNCLDL